MTATAQHQQLESFYDDPTLRRPVAMQQPESAKNITVYVNGDKYNPGRKFVVNRKHVHNFDGFLTLVTNGLRPSFGAVRQIYTPNEGHKVTELDAIRNGMPVVAGGVERFRKLAYKEITGIKRKPQQKPKSESIKPVTHSKMQVAARWKELSRQPCNIYVYGNGDINMAAVKLLLVPRILKSWEMVLQEVTEKIAFKTGQACRRLYTTEGVQIFGSDQLENGRYYVSVGNERFKRLPYGERAQHMAMLSSSKRSHHLPPLARRGHTNTGQQVDSTYSQKYAARRQLEEDRGHASLPPTIAKPSSHRRLGPIRGTPSRDTESVFHNKPMKVKRSSDTGKITRVAMDNKDDVFRAKRRAIVAEEVDDDDDTKVDLPIDQVAADIVEEEEHPQSSRRKGSDGSGRLHHKPSPEPKQTYAPRIDEDDSDLTAPSKTPTSARRNEPQPTARSEPSNGSPTKTPRKSTSPTKQIDDLKLKNDAAIVIQSNYRGYTARRALKVRREENAVVDEPPDIHRQDMQIEESDNRQSTPERPIQPAVTPQNDAPPAPSEGHEAQRESAEFDDATVQPTRPESKKSVSEDVEEVNARQPSPQESLVLAGNSPNDEGAKSTTSETPETAPEEPEPRETSPFEKSHSDEQLTHDDERPPANSPSKIGDEATGLPARDDGDGTDDDKHGNTQAVPVPDNAGTEPEALQEPSKTAESPARSGELTPNDASTEHLETVKTPSRDEVVMDGEIPAAKDKN